MYSRYSALAGFRRRGVRLFGRWRETLVWLCLCWSIPSEVAAGDGWPEIKLHAFGTAGLVYVPTGAADFIRDVTQLHGAKAGQWSAEIDSLVGAQVNLKFNDQFEAVGQAVSRHRYDDSYRPELTWAFAKYMPRPDLELRAGRLGTDFYMRSDSRLVGYSYLTVRPSVDYYGAVPYYYLDGADASFSYPIGSGILRTKLYAGINSEKVALENSAPWDSASSFILGGSLDYTIDSWQFRFGYFQIDMEEDLPGSFANFLGILRSTPLPGAQTAAQRLSVAGNTGRHYSGGVIYDEGPLQVQLMVSGVKYDSVFFQDSISGFLLGGYRVGDLTPYAGLSWSSSSPAHLGTTGSPALDGFVSSTIARTGMDQHTYTLGVRWDFYPGMDVKLQWDSVLGSPASTLLYRWEQPGWSGQVHALSLALDFAF